MENSIIKETGPEVETVMTSLQGHITATLDDLVKTFGWPEMGGNEDKVTKEWAIMFLNGEVATIYDWKSAYPNDGSEYTWNIGGRDGSAVSNVHEEFNNKMQDPMKEIKGEEMETKYYYLDNLKGFNMKVATQKWNEEKDEFEYAWVDTLTDHEKLLIDLVAPNQAVTLISQIKESFREVTNLAELKRKIKRSLIKEWCVTVEFEYETEIDFGIAGSHTIYGTQEADIDVEAKDEEEAEEKVINDVTSEYEITDAWVNHTVEQ